MFAIEDYPLENPYYHLSTDTIDTLNLDFHADVVRGLAVALSDVTASE